MCEQEVLRSAEATRLVPSAGVGVRWRGAGRAARLLTTALPLALGACGVLSPWLGPDDPAAAGAAGAAALDATPARADELALAVDSDIMTMGWVQAAAPEPAAAALPAAYLASGPQRPASELPQLAAVNDTTLEGLRGGFSLANGVTVNFGASIRSIARQVVDSTTVIPVFELETNFTLDAGAAGATVQTALNGAPPTVTTGIDPAVGIQVSAGDAGSTLVVHNVSTSQFNTLLQNVVDNTDVSSVTTLDFFLGGTIGALTSQAATTQSNLNSLLSNSLVNSLPY